MKTEIKRALVVQQYRAVGRIIGRALGQIGYAHECAYDVDRAFDKLSREKFDLIISSVHLRHFQEGLRLLEKVFADETLKHIPFILYVMPYNEAESIPKAKALGIAHFLIGPADRLDVQRKVKELETDLILAHVG